VTVSAPPSAAVRSPWPVRSAAALLVLLALASTVGVVLFGVIWNDDPIGSGAVFAAFMIATAVTAIAAVPALLRGEATGWAITLLWGCCYAYWSVYKVFAEEEFESLGFLVAAVGVVALLCSRAARTHAGISR
jgi:FtsH-binding integral membrane protein